MKVIALKTAVSNGDNLIKDVTIRDEITAGDMWDLPTDPKTMGDEALLIRAATGLTLSIIRKLSPLDFVVLLEASSDALLGKLSEEKT